MGDDILPSWRPGPARDAVVTFLDAAESVPREQRLACFDNDGTLWCERPTYVQYEFFVDALRTAVLSEPSLATVPEFAALLAQDREAIGEMGLERIAYALTRLFEGQGPEDFTARVREFLARAHHRSLGRPLRSNTYLPMHELMSELRRRGFTVCIVTGGGHGVPPSGQQ
ncbi:HAD family hydrolase [Janibacter alittae]|uniref:HAD family hydrolase n=1 Tax=Janibacter alittae TaxID=3115209 RepID=A0ABZ2MED4_9MICO